MNFDSDVISGYIDRGPISIVCQGVGVADRFCFFTDTKQIRGTTEHPITTYTVQVGVNNNGYCTWEKHLFTEKLLEDMYLSGQIQLVDDHDDDDRNDDDHDDDDRNDDDRPAKRVKTNL